MNAIEQLEYDEREAWKAYSNYHELGNPLKDKWHALYLKLAREKLKAEIMAESQPKPDSLNTEQQ